MAATCLPSLCSAAQSAAPARPRPKAATDFSRPYVSAADWPKLPPTLVLGAVCGAAIGEDTVFVLHRGNPPVLCLDAEGKLLRSWGNGQIGMGHHIRYEQGHVWITDIEHHQVLKFTPAGRLVMELGKKDQPGRGLDQFNMPTDVAVLPSGEFYVADGYGNSRIMRFTAAGKLLYAWGTKGRDPGQFDTPHDLAVDTRGRLYVSDRSNSRIQVFEGDAVFIEEWRDYPQINGLAWGTERSTGWACGPEICGEGLGLYGTTGRGNEILRMRTGAVLLESFGGPTSTEAETQAGVVPPLGRFNVLHGLAVDPQGNIYVGEIRSRRVQKLLRQKVTG